MWLVCSILGGVHRPWILLAAPSYTQSFLIYTL